MFTIRVFGFVSFTIVCTEPGHGAGHCCQCDHKPRIYSWASSSFCQTLGGGRKGGRGEFSVRQSAFRSQFRSGSILPLIFGCDWLLSDCDVSSDWSRVITWPGYCPLIGCYLIMMYPLIGRELSRDLDTALWLAAIWLWCILWLVESYHVSWILPCDWLLSDYDVSCLWPWPMSPHCSCWPSITALQLRHNSMSDIWPTLRQLLWVSRFLLLIWQFHFSAGILYSQFWHFDWR